VIGGDYNARTGRAGGEVEEEELRGKRLKKGGSRRIER